MGCHGKEPLLLPPRFNVQIERAEKSAVVNLSLGKKSTYNSTKIICARPTLLLGMINI